MSGLCNLGNTCYINCIIQSLSNITDFRNVILDYSGDNNTLNILKKIFVELWKENQIISPVSFVNNIKKIFPKYNNHEKHDASEFLLDLFDYIHENDGTNSVNVTKTKNKNIILAVDTWDKSLNYSSSVITQLFYGQYCKHIICQGCDKTTYHFDVFLYLDIKSNDVSVQILIKNRFSRDYFYKSCEECNGNQDSDTEHVVITSIYKLPKILIIYIYLNKIINNNIIIDKQIDLSDYSMDTNIIYNYT